MSGDRKLVRAIRYDEHRDVAEDEINRTNFGLEQRLRIVYAFCSADKKNNGGPRVAARFVELILPDDGLRWVIPSGYSVGCPRITSTILGKHEPTKRCEEP